MLLLKKEYLPNIKIPIVSIANIQKVLEAIFFSVTEALADFVKRIFKMDRRFIFFKAEYLKFCSTDDKFVLTRNKVSRQNLI